MDHITIGQLKQEANEDVLTASLDAQLQSISIKKTKSGSPYAEVTFVDALNQFTIKVWENKPQFIMVQELAAGALVRLSGDWTQNKYGVDGVRWDIRLLKGEEIEAFMAGDPELHQRQQKDWNDILLMLGSIADPRLKRLSDIFVEKYSERFCRTAAARKNHHARRGGLVEHVSQMMRTAVAVSGVYEKLNKDLLIVGVLLHDCGKMWENSYPQQGFAQPYDLEGEMLGHIPKGMEVCSHLWSQMIDEESLSEWEGLFPLTDHVRIHLLHLIASHHGIYEFGSPTLPRTPEAHALHYIDNLDAKYEMLSMAYESAQELAPGIYERQFPLPTNLVEPLAHFPRVEPSDSLKEEEIFEPEEELEAKPFNGELF